GEWDKELLEYVGVPEAILPEVKPSVGYFGDVDCSIYGAPIRITGVAGDQHAALFGQACFDDGDAKNTYGTSNVPMMTIGKKPIQSDKGLLSLAWQMDGDISYCMGASILTTGSAVQWLRDKLHIITSAAQSEEMAKSCDDTMGVYFVPAFSGLAAPHWDMDARGMLIGLTAGVTDAHIARATLESIAYQTRDLIDEIEKESGVKLKVLKVDGGATVNNYLLQFQADILNCVVERPTDIETTSLGAAYMAGLGVGIWKSTDELKKIWKCDKRFTPQMDEATREELYSGWKRAVAFSRGWLDPNKKLDY
ncbi:MAG: glycerol kinase, partial [Erysipelothrix sp.]|nr:glycerol kinase [Erysipelothrix sp.]